MVIGQRSCGMPRAGRIAAVLLARPGAGIAVPPEKGRQAAAAGPGQGAGGLPIHGGQLGLNSGGKGSPGKLAEPAAETAARCSSNNSTRRCTLSSSSRASLAPASISTM